MNALANQKKTKPEDLIQSDSLIGRGIFEMRGRGILQYA